jgi:hypothetical protein
MKTRILFLASFLMMGVFFYSSSAQISVSPGLDIYSSYVWRGTKFGTGPSFQPSVSMKAGGLTIGAWGAYDASGYQEADLYASYALPIGLTIIATDYFYPGVQSYTDFSSDSTAHAFELGASYTIGKFSVSGNYIFNETTGAATMGGDKYFEASYAFAPASIFVGAGDGWHTADTKFALCNVGVKSTKEIKVTDSFTIPVTGMLVVNPDKEFITLVVGLTF